MESVSWAEDPSAFDAGGRGFGAFSVCEDEHAVPAATILWVVCEASGCLEVGASGANSFDVRVGAFLPFDHVLVCDCVVEWEDGDRDSFGECRKFAEE